MKTVAIALMTLVCIDFAAVQASPPPAIVPLPRNELGWWKERHGKKVKEAAKGDYDLVFIGDSITQGWEEKGRSVWREYYAERKALNLGFSGDCTEHVLWRLRNGELAKVFPKLFVLMIGTNNTGWRQDPPRNTARGIVQILKLLQRERPESKILLLSIFPRDGLPEGQLRQLNNKVNALIKPLADGERVFWLDLSGAFLDEKGILTVRVMPDGLHPSKHGYELWAKGMEPTIRRLLK